MKVLDLEFELTFKEWLVMLFKKLIIKRKILFVSQKDFGKGCDKIRGQSVDIVIVDDGEE